MTSASGSGTEHVEHQEMSPLDLSRQKITNTQSELERTQTKSFETWKHRESAFRLHKSSHIFHRLTEIRIWRIFFLFLLLFVSLCWISSLEYSSNSTVDPNSKSPKLSTISPSLSRIRRRLISFISADADRSKLVVAGSFSVGSRMCNIAQMNLYTREWNTSDCVQLSVYNSYAGGEVYSLVANHSVAEILKASTSEGEIDFDSARVLAVGAFDVTYRNSQLTYCSVGEWNGYELLKVGEGLCTASLLKGMKITSAIYAGEHDLYVAGSFDTRVWNGDLHEYVQIHNIAHYNSREQIWSPLKNGQLSCAWCTVTVLTLAWDSSRRQLHVGGKFDAINGLNIPAGLAIYDSRTQRLVAHPGGGLMQMNATQDGVATSIQLDENNSVLYIMGSFERLSATGELCKGFAAYEIIKNRWTCLADPSHSILPQKAENMLLTPYGLMVAGLTVYPTTTWDDPIHPYTIALMSTTIGQNSVNEEGTKEQPKFNWTWLPGFKGHNRPLRSLSNGFGDYEGSVFIAGDDFVSKWSYVSEDGKKSVPILEDLTGGMIHGAVKSISQLVENPQKKSSTPSIFWYSIIVYGVSLGSVAGVFLAIMFNKNLNAALISFLNKEGRNGQGISLDTLTYSTLANPTMQDAYHRAMKTRFIFNPLVLTMIDPKEIFLHRIIGEGTFGRVWSANWKSSDVAVKEFVFAQAAVAGKSSMQKEIIDEIIGEAGMMAMLRHPYVLQLFGCSLTAQAIWIVSELCKMGSLRQLLDRQRASLSMEVRLQLAIHVAEGMAYLHNQDPHIIHRDLKSHNIFISGEEKKPSPNYVEDISDQSNETSPLNGCTHGTNSFTNGYNSTFQPGSTYIAKIGDWGSARAAFSGSRTMTHGVGTACWLAPEVIKYARSSRSSDVYSFAIVLWELATGEEVYADLESTQIIAGVASENLRPYVPENCPWSDLMVQCWDEIPQNRLSFEAIVIELNNILMAFRRSN